MEMLTFADAHCHCNPIKGIGAREIAEKFRRNGGWFLGLISLPPWSYAIRPEGIKSYEKSFKLLVKQGEAAREVGLACAIHLGFHPAEVDKLASMGIDLNGIKKLGLKVLNLACKFISEGLAQGLGEFGRQHYSTKPERRRVAEEILKEALIKADELNVPIHLHLEQGGKITVKFILNLLKELKVREEIIVIHHLPAKHLKFIENTKLKATIVGKLDELKEAVKSKPGTQIYKNSIPHSPRI